MELKVIERDGFFGIVNSSTKQIVAHIKYESIEILCGEYFLMQENGKKFILNSNFNLIFEFNNQPYKNQFANKNGTFQIICIEEDGSVLNLFGENTTLNSGISINKISINHSILSEYVLSKSAYLSLMKKETGFDIEKEQLKRIII
jgi:hypothetical protein